MTDKSSAQTKADEAYREHIRQTAGWTDFAKMHTQISAAEHKAAFMAGYAASPSPPPSAGVDAVARIEALVRWHRARLADPHNYSLLARGEHRHLIDTIEQLAALTPAPTPVEAGGDQALHDALVAHSESEMASEALLATLVEAGGEADGWIDDTDVAVLARIKGQAGACRITAIKAHGGPGYVPFYLSKPASEPADGAVRDWNAVARRMQRAGAPGTEEELEAALRAALSAPASSSPAKPAPAAEAVREAAAPFVAIADGYSDAEDDGHEIWRDASERLTRVTLGQCRALRAALAPAARAGTVAQEGRE